MDLSMQEDRNGDEKYKVLLEIAKQTLTVEAERKKSLESRAGVLVGFNGLALITLLNSSTKVLEMGIPAFNELMYDTVMFTPIVKLPIFTEWAPIISVVLFIFSILGLVRSLYKCIRVIGKLRQYKGVDMKKIINLFLQQSDYMFYMQSIAIYVNALEANRQLTEKKFRDFGAATNSLVFSVCCLVMWYIFFHLCLTYRVF